MKKALAQSKFLLHGICPTSYLQLGLPTHHFHLPQAIRQCLMSVPDIFSKSNNTMFRSYSYTVSAVTLPKESITMFFFCLRISVQDQNPGAEAVGVQVPSPEAAVVDGHLNQAPNLHALVLALLLEIHLS